MRYESTPDAHPSFIEERKSRIEALKADTEFLKLSKHWRQMALERKYMNSFSWLGRPLIQFPGDVMAVQELVSVVKPDVIVETGIAHGGSLILSSSLQHLNGIKKGRVIGVDIEIRPHNRKAIEKSEWYKMITLIEGSSIAPEIVEQVRKAIKPEDKVMVFLDSNHTHAHVLAELNSYSTMVTPGSYIVVFDTHIEDMPDDYVWKDRPWGKGNNPKTAVHEWLKSNSNFHIDSDIEYKVLLTSAPDGFLFRDK
jgi:cephalosporin hydroxylase